MPLQVQNNIIEKCILMAASEDNLKQWLQSKMYETKFIKKNSLQKSFLPVFEVFRENMKTFELCLINESLMIE